LKRVLIANRGEIAVRIIRACHSLGLEAYLAVSSADKETLGARMADRTICVGPPPSSLSYLNMNALVAAAEGSGCDAIHPGYGFLAERASFARLVEDAGLVFIGPSSDVIELMGDKVRARKVSQAAGVPVSPGTGRISDIALAEEFADQHGLPLLIKASAGGGGRGMRLIRDRAEIPGAFRSASAEASSAFGDSGLFIERYFERARHVEVQVLGDTHGKTVHLGERDCSVQRRYQKLLEEAPADAISEQVRAKMTSSAVGLAAGVSYVGAGTVEFIVDNDTNEFYFLEMNTRIQVEHPITEMVTGIDIVISQFEVAAGKPLPFAQGDINVSGHAIECRINAEDAAHGFRPSPGTITDWEPPVGDGIRVDSHCYSGYVVPPHYDSLMAKIIVHEANREAAINKMRNALEGLHVTGVATTVPFHLAILDNPDYRAGRVRTRWVEEEFMPDWSL
jgi:acetyl-CoA carboxylase biotin carboxylase subunit